MLVTTPPHGVRSPHKADWTPLKGRTAHKADSDPAEGPDGHRLARPRPGGVGICAGPSRNSLALQPMCGLSRCPPTSPRSGTWLIRALLDAAVAAELKADANGNREKTPPKDSVPPPFRLTNGAVEYWLEDDDGEGEWQFVCSRLEVAAVTRSADWATRATPKSRQEN